jgi:hypothetical protein
MAKADKTSETPATDPHAVLRQPADPPRPNRMAFLIAAGCFFAWFAYLVYVAWRG